MRLNELTLTDPRSTEIEATAEEVVSLLVKNCSEAMMSWHTGRMIYKGFHGVTKDFYHTNPKLLTRKSKNTSNYYTLLMSNLPSWKAYPKRNQCVVATNNYRAAMAYADAEGPYIAFPFNRTKIGVCSQADLWDSFPNLIELGIGSVLRFNAVFSDYDLPDDSYENFINALMRKIVAREFGGISSDLSDAKNKAEAIKIFDKILGPKQNGFALKTPANFPGGDQELWFDGEAYLLRVMSPLFKAVTPLLKEAASNKASDDMWADFQKLKGQNEN
jgi:hypothetical protein